MEKNIRAQLADDWQKSADNEASQTASLKRLFTSKEQEHPDFDKKIKALFALGIKEFEIAEENAADSSGPYAGKITFNDGSSVTLNRRNEDGTLPDYRDQSQCLKNTIGWDGNHTEDLARAVALFASMTEGFRENGVKLNTAYENDGFTLWRAQAYHALDLSIKPSTEGFSLTDKHKKNNPFQNILGSVSSENPEVALANSQGQNGQGVAVTHQQPS